MAKTKYSIEDLKVAMIPEDQIPSDILERVEGYEEFSDYTSQKGIGEKIYLVEKLHEIIIGKEDDTNETTKIRIKELYKQIKKYDCVLFTRST